MEYTVQGDRFRKGMNLAAQLVEGRRGRPVDFGKKFWLLYKGYCTCINLRLGCPALL